MPVTAAHVTVALAAVEGRVGSLAGGLGNPGTPGREEKLVQLQAARHARDLLGALDRAMQADLAPMQKGGPMPALDTGLVTGVCEAVASRYGVLSSQVPKPEGDTGKDEALQAIRDTVPKAPEPPKEEPKAPEPAKAEELPAEAPVEPKVSEPEPPAPKAEPKPKATKKADKKKR